MIRYKRVRGDISSGVENLLVNLEGPEGFRRTVLGIIAENTTDLIAVGYLDQDQVVDIDGDLCGANGCDSFENGWIPVNRELNTGDKFSAGYNNQTGDNATGVDIIIVYEESR